MPNVALASIVSVLVGCAGVRPGVAAGGGGETGESDGCNRDFERACAGRGYDDVALAITTLAVLGVLVPRFVRSLRD